MLNILNITLVLAMMIHLWNCPYSKVEESFNIQAMHDLLYHRNNISNYDHLQFPGVVPRTFIGAIFVAGVAFPVIEVMEYIGIQKIYSQLLCRCILGILVSISFIKLQKSIAHRTSPAISKLVTVFTITQFHFMFYASRTLPNTFALILVQLAISSWLLNEHKKFIWYSAFAIILFRSELCLFMGFLLLIKLVKRQIKLMELIIYGATAALLALGMTVSVDSFFWRRWLWPEGEVLYFNTILNKSSKWGTLPYFWYFYSAIPRSLLFSVIFVPIGLCCRQYKEVHQLLIATLFYILTYSLLPHKELRFIIYVFPILNVAVAIAVIQILHILRSYKKLKRLFYLLICGVCIGNMCGTALFGYISSRNYPGGEAFSILHTLKQQNYGNCSIHINNAAAQTGVTRFGEIYEDCRYSKDEHFEFSPSTEESSPYTYLIVESPCLDSKRYKVKSVVNSFVKVKLKRAMPFFEILEEEKLCILKLKKRIT